MSSLKDLDHKQLFYILLDLIMMLILLANLTWIVFDWIFSIQEINTLVSEYFPVIYKSYLPIHRHFFFYDLFFLAVFVAELLIRWAISIYKGTYHRWFFYPFVHWYDTIGCVPIGSLRFLRILRIVSIFSRLQRLKLLDFTNTYLYKKIYKYIDALTEEISDRVTVNIIEGIQEHLQQGSPVITQINRNVVKSQRSKLADWLSARLQKVARENYPDYKQGIQDYINTRIKEAVGKNKEISSIGYIPVLGQRVTRNIENIVSDLVFSILNDSMQDIASHKVTSLVDEISELVFEALLSEEKDSELNLLMSDILVQSLEIVKKQVLIQQWKYKH